MSSSAYAIASRAAAMAWLTITILTTGTISVRPAAAGPAIGQFELKDLEAGADHLQFQSQNAYAFGQPDRHTATLGGEDVYDDNTVVRQRHALEVEQGLTDTLKFRLGIEFEKERIDDPASPTNADDFANLKLSEIGGEVVWVLLPREGNGMGFGTVVEVEHPLSAGEPNHISFGAIVEWASGPLEITLLPMLVQAWGGAEPGEHADDKLDFAYATKVAYRLSSSWTLALEAYGTVDRLGQTGHAIEAQRLFGDHDQHRLGPIAYYEFETDDGGPDVSIGVGYLVGLTNNTPDGTAKVSIELEY